MQLLGAPRGQTVGNPANCSGIDVVSRYIQPSKLAQTGKSPLKRLGNHARKHVPPSLLSTVVTLLALTEHWGRLAMAVDESMGLHGRMTAS